MKPRAILPLLLLSFLVIPLVHAEPARYWFQVGVVVVDSEAAQVTGASVEINVHSEQPQGASLSYWVGLTLANGAFIQVGYLIDSGSARWFWAYFTENNEYIEYDGSYVTPGWANFSIASSTSAEWITYVSAEQIGKVNLGATDSGRNAPYAMAEDPQVTAPTANMGPVEFRNLQFRTRDAMWHSARVGRAYIGYGGGSAKLPEDASYPYGISFQQGRDNYWIAGSVSSSVKDGQILWPWHQVQVNSAAGTITDPSGWYTYNTTTVTIVVPSIRETGRGQLVFWYWSASGRNTLLSAARGLNQTAQFKLNSSITVSAIYRLRNCF